MSYHKGQRLRIQPSDEHDSHALEMAGQECIFLQYRTAPHGSQYAMVQFPSGRPSSFRLEDLVPVEAER